MRVQIDPAKLAAMGLSLEDVRGVLGERGQQPRRARIDGGAQSFTVYDNDQLLKAAPWNDVVVAYRNGAPVRVRDIGVAIDAPENNKVAAWANGGRGHHRSACLQAARRQRDRDGRAHQGGAAAAAGVDPADGQRQHPGRPDADDPRLGARTSSSR